MNNYSFRNTYRMNENTFIEDRGYPYIVDNSNENYAILSEKFAELEIGKTALRTDIDEFEIVDGCPMLELIRENKINELKKKFSERFNTLVIESSIGFPIDANEKASINVRGLLETMENTVYFCDADNNFHEVTKENVETILKEIIEAQQSLYQIKWNLRNQIQEESDVINLQELNINL